MQHSQQEQAEYSQREAAGTQESVDDVWYGGRGRLRERVCVCQGDVCVCVIYGRISYDDVGMIIFTQIIITRGRQLKNR